MLDDDDEITILKVVVDGEALQRARLEESIPGNSQMEDPECDVCIVIVLFGAMYLPETCHRYDVL